MVVHRRSLPRNLLGLPNNLPVPIYTPGWREALWELRAEIRKYRESADRSEKTIFFLFSPKEPIWLTVFGNDIKRFDFLFLYSKFAKPENSATGSSTAAMKLEIWHMFNTLMFSILSLLGGNFFVMLVCTRLLLLVRTLSAHTQVMV